MTKAPGSLSFNTLMAGRRREETNKEAKQGHDDYCYFLSFTWRLMNDSECSLYSGALTLLSGDVRLVPVLGRVLNKLDVHLNVRIAICLETGE